MIHHQFYHVTAAGYVWLAWIAFGAIFEIFDLVYHIPWTLSRNTWAIEHLDMKHPLMFAEWTPLHWGIAIVLWSLFLWLSLHLPFGWLRA